MQTTTTGNGIKQYSINVVHLVAVFGLIVLLGACGAYLISDNSDAAGETFSSNGFTFEVISNDSVKVTGYSSGAMADVNIPDTVTNGLHTYRVTSIGSLASTSMQTLTIPLYAEQMDSKAFYASTKLSTVYFNAISMQDGTSSSQWFCTKSLVSSDLSGPRTFVFGDSVEHIPAYLCAGHTVHLQTVYISQSVVSIGDSAFKSSDFSQPATAMTIYFYGIPSTFGPSCFSRGGSGWSSVNYGEVNIYSMMSSGFLDDYDNNYTRLHYYSLPHVKLNLSGKTPSPVPSGWNLYNGYLVKYYAESDPISIPSIHVTGYTFTGWNMTPATIMGNSTLTYTSSWEINHVTLTFDTGEGTPVAPIHQDYNTVISVTNPTRTGYNFICWSPVLPDRVPEFDQTYTAVWELQKHTVTYDVDGGDPIDSILITYGTAIPLPIPEKEGYSFINWTLSPSGDTMGESDVTATAHWSINTYTLKFNTDGGTVIADIVEPFGTPISVQDPIKDGFVFEGWNPSIPSTVPSSNQTYTAQWAVEHHTVTYDTNGGDPIAPCEVDFNESIPLPTPHRTYYDFQNWILTPSGTTMGHSDVTATAVWQPVAVTLTFNTNGGTTIGPINGHYNDPLQVTAPTKTGYTFGGWSPALPSNMPGVDTQYTAQWKVTVTFDANGGSGTQSPLVVYAGTNCTLQYSTTFHAPSGKTFAGWSLTPNGSTVFNITPTQNTTVYAKWNSSAPAPSTKVTLTLKEKTYVGGMYYSTAWYHGGTVDGAGTYDKGQNVQIKAVAKENYRFVKWEEDGNTSPTRTVNVNTSTTYTAVFESWTEEQQKYEEQSQQLGFTMLLGGLGVVVFGALVLVALFRRH